MNRKLIHSLLLISIFVCFSCKKELEPQDNSDAVHAAPTASDPTAMATQQNTSDPAAQQTASAAAVAPGQTVPASAQQRVANADHSGINPAHGKPGHRCDIAVGAPLNSPPGKKTTPAATPSITPTTPAATITTASNPTASTPAILKTDAVTTPTAPGMNPPHGKEGHRCDIAVGAALPKS